MVNIEDYEWVAPNWRRIMSRTRKPGEYFYYNVVTKETTWNLVVVSNSQQTYIRPENGVMAMQPVCPIPPGPQSSLADLQECARGLVRFVKLLIEESELNEEGSSNEVPTAPPSSDSENDTFSIDTASSLNPLSHIFDLDSDMEASITIESYLERIVSYSRVTVGTYVIAAAYLMRLFREFGFRMTARNVHKSIIAAVLVASKYAEDCRITNSFFACVGGISPGEMNRLEKAFIEMLEWRLNVIESDVKSVEACLNFPNQGKDYS